MSRAFKCDRCEEYRDGGVHNRIKVFGKGLNTFKVLSVCHGCARELLGEHVDFEGDEP